MSKIEVNTIEPQCGTTLTLGGSGDTVTLGSGASQSGFKAVDWQTSSIKTATFTAATGKGYFCNTNGGSFTVNLPAGTAGDTIAVADYSRDFGTNSLTVAPNGSEKIGGVAASATLTVDGQAATFVYVDSTEGWINVQETQTSVFGTTYITASVSGTGNTLTTSGNCKVAKFTGPGTFTVCSVGNVAANNQVSYIVVGGGASGGAGNNNNNGSGGGGAGGFREDKSPATPYTASPLDGAGDITVTAQGYPIVIGAGGTASSPQNPGAAGNTSTFSTISSAGGGAGAYNNSGVAGASGGGGADTGNPGGAGNTPPVSPPQGNAGGNGIGSAPAYGGGGGGGATAAGTNGAAPTAGAGGAGATTCISATPTAYAGGGGGGAYMCGTAAAGGTGGGGAGANKNASGTAGTANTGGGGGGANNPSGTSGAGGSGIVIIRYKFQ